MKKVLTIAGSDCSGGAGIQADIKAFSAHGAFGMSVIVSVVAENTSRVIGVHDLPPEMIEQQIDAVFEDVEVDAVKIGMLSRAESMLAVAERLRRYAPPNIVLDPVMYAKNGSPLMDPSAIETLLEAVTPLAWVVTPNIPEAERMTGMTIATEADMEQAARRIHAMGCRNVLLKGGHGAASQNAVDILFDGARCHRYTAPRIDTKNTHGTGCTLSSAIAANLALGLAVPDAVERAKAYVTTAIAHALPIGKGNGPTHHFYDLYKNGLAPIAQKEE